MEKNTKFGVLLFLYMVSVIGFSAWFLSAGGINEPVQLLLSFIKDGRADPHPLSFNMVVGFVLLDLLLSIFAIIMLRIITGKPPKMFFKKWERILSMPVYSLFYNITAFVAAEEIFYRWFPLAVLWPLLGGTLFGLWALIIASSLVFGMCHIINQEPGNDRKFVYTLPQMIGGVVLSYIFLAFGFLGAVVIHLSFDVLLIACGWMGYRYDPKFLKQS